MGPPNNSDICARYDVELAAGIISKNNYQRVAVQLPDCMLEDSLLLSNAIKGELDKGGGSPLPSSYESTGMITPCCGGKSRTEDEYICGKEDNTVGSTPNGVNIYILGDTSLNECCEDYVSAEHVKADVLLHYGPSCQSLVVSSIPSVYFFSERKQEESFYKTVKEGFIQSNFPKRGEVCMVLCDVGYTGCMSRLVNAFVEVGGDAGGVDCGSGMKPLFLVDGRLVGGESFLRSGTGETKAGETKSGATETGATKAGETKAGETKAGETKAGETKSGAIDNDGVQTHEVQSDAVHTNVIACLNRIANNVQGKNCYGDHRNYVQLEAEEDLEGKYAFFCGRLMIRVLSSQKMGTLIYEVIRKEEMCPPWGTILTKGEEQRTNLFLFTNGNLNLKRRCILEYEGYPDRVHIYEEEGRKHLGANGNGSNEISNFETKKDLDKLLLKRYSLIEKCKLVDTFGILMANVNLKKNRELKNCLSYILRSRGKKCFTIATNKLNGPKLENFSDIEMYILLSCPEKNFLELPDFSKKIITPCEFFIAYGYMEWQCRYLFEFFHLLDIPSVRRSLDGLRGGKYLLWSLECGSPSLADVRKGVVQSGTALEEGTDVECGDPEPSVSLEGSSGTSQSLLACHPLVDPSLPIPVEEQKKFITTFDERSPMCKYFLETLVENTSREYRGVEMNYNTDTVPEVVPGDDGIAQRYESDLRFCG
ncbi:diphthamide synthesis protein, putative [Plasmodium knowlesi strain H]|uniref:Diphthamide synthesis protein, putative n=3 Tax=Plasmodium knowlesi TaxID=5850 RepID=A0A5K1U4Y2_PLAKH|nr:diphthamide biosynthesis protein 2, putative [Plasmodium knowlesi strain H]OTN67745.1 putative Diphthamide synthesis protein [Plasmodium knowlesi]CAA9990328.1 diphthamide biosynthesis protein 2, putative [Plasmodium knowlesi strain H]SBO19534.1 diphthamide synthesis protein, putative [Plasmodium knowlesi strain H]SBO22769.1 diphthamide synthesis protein, putative [Plasmodium knowlesi strain H]VVS79802.1 diphthamide biosynthesis protein 2, putative [Plasmodium knowlesi strain H]|eukprot:XP_002260728.1 hypothetical protein, conserved in Plasmodium species [Plasmodium knowlesi strain H]